jgi:hypothetical protein
VRLQTQKLKELSLNPQTLLSMVTYAKRDMIANKPADKILIYSMNLAMKTVVLLNIKMSTNVNATAILFLAQTEEKFIQKVITLMKATIAIKLGLTILINILMIRLLPQLRKLLVIY